MQVYFQSLFDHIYIEGGILLNHHQCAASTWMIYIYIYIYIYIPVPITSEIMSTPLIM